IVRNVEKVPTERNKKGENYKSYNIGNNNSVKLLDFIDSLETELGIPANRDFLPMQPGDVERTWANVDDLINDYYYRPNTTIKEGITAFIQWYKNYHGE